MPELPQLSLPRQKLLRNYWFCFIASSNFITRLNPHFSDTINRLSVGQKKSRHKHVVGTGNQISTGNISEISLLNYFVQIPKVVFSENTKNNFLFDICPSV